MVLILDNSATMRATDVPPTRMDEVQNVAQRLIDGLRWCDVTAVVRMSPAPTEVQSPTSDRELLKRAVDSVQAGTNAPAIELAVKLAREILESDGSRIERIVLITDACSKEATKRVQQSGVEVLRVGTAASNLGITGFTARRSNIAPNKWEAMVEVSNQSNESAQGQITIEIDEKPGSSAQFSIAPDSRWQHVFELDVPASADLRAKLVSGDSYVFDDTAELDLPAAAVANRTGTAGQPPWNDEIQCAGCGRPDVKSKLSISESVKQVNDLSGSSTPGIDIRAPRDIGSDASAVIPGKPGLPLWIMPAAVAAALVIVEWCLYQRRWTS
jgi:hypothetical protein